MKYFENNVEAVVNAFLENNLPEFDENIEYATNIEDNESNDYVTSKLTDEFSELSMRKNIYDGDNFDIFKPKADLDLTKIYLGKR